MSRVRLLLAAVLAVSALAVLAGPAVASAPAANPKFCTAASKIGRGTSTETGLQEAAKGARGFKDASKYAPKKVKAAMVQISKLLGALSGKDPSALAKYYSSKGFVKNYTKAIGVYSTYYASNC